MTLFSMKPTLACLRVVFPMFFYLQLSSGLCQSYMYRYSLGLQNAMPYGRQKSDLSPSGIICWSAVVLGLLYTWLVIDTADPIRFHCIHVHTFRLSIFTNDAELDVFITGL